ncbi:MAG TPA: multiheme c-type cytochrome [Kofleriaceae bacterium]|nr:multiheme c-type cytochrome [Kofleriaceae bacterium]
MRRLAVITALVALATSAGVAIAAQRDWTGTAACGGCHPAELAAWQATPHASTRARFADAKPQARCLACHGTGEAPAGPTIAVEVGCEACHGAGSAYAPDDVMRDPALSRALGLADLSTPQLRAQLCASCHKRSTTGRDVDPTAPVHGVRK